MKITLILNQIYWILFFFFLFLRINYAKINENLITDKINEVLNKSLSPSFSFAEKSGNKADLSNKD